MVAQRQPPPETESGRGNEAQLARFRDRIMNLRSQIQEDINELSSEDES